MEITPQNNVENGKTAVYVKSAQLKEYGIGETKSMAWGECEMGKELVLNWEEWARALYHMQHSIYTQSWKPPASHLE